MVTAIGVCLQSGKPSKVLVGQASRSDCSHVRRTTTRRCQRMPCAATLDPLGGNIDTAFTAIDRYVQRQMEEATKMVERASSEAFTSPSATTATTTQRNGVTTFQREYSNSSSSNGGTSTTYYRQVIITNTGAPPQGYAMQGPHMLPPLPLLALLAALAGAWFAATRRFLANYQCTLYCKKRRLLFALTWPVLVLFSPDFRRQFTSALRGERVRSSTTASVDDEA